MAVNIYKKLTDDFIRLINENKLSHVYLFFGEDQKTILDFSKKIANFLENGKFETPKALNDCCIFSPNEKGVIGIDEIRFFQDFLYKLPAISRKRMAIIFGGENLTQQAQSALLKIIEEPPQNSLIILISNESSVLMPTIVSRAHRIYFPSTRISADQGPEAGQVCYGAYADKRGRKTQAASKGKINGKIAEESVEARLEEILTRLAKDPINNAKTIKFILDRLRLIKTFNLNEKLQIKYINAYLKKKNN